jgi:hypothetical protein
VVSVHWDGSTGRGKTRLAWARFFNIDAIDTQAQKSGRLRQIALDVLYPASMTPTLGQNVANHQKPAAFCHIEQMNG